MMFKIGDTVRVLRHRNFYGQNAVGTSLKTGQIIKLVGEDKDCSTDEFTMFSVEDVGDGWPWLIRSDDIEPVATGPVQLVPQVIPGTYGKVRVTEGGYVHCKSMKTAEEIRDTITTLEQIAEAM